MFDLTGGLMALSSIFVVSNSLLLQLHRSETWRNRERSTWVTDMPKSQLLYGFAWIKINKMPAIVSVLSLQCKHGVFILHCICLLFLWHHASKTINLWDERVEAMLLMVACNHKFVAHVLDKNKIKLSKPNFTALHLIEIGHERKIHGPPFNTCISIIHCRIAASSSSSSIF